jgi:hypothetical protein
MKMKGIDYTELDQQQPHHLDCSSGCSFDSKSAVSLLDFDDAVE